MERLPREARDVGRPRQHSDPSRTQAPVQQWLVDLQPAGNRAIATLLRPSIQRQDPALDAPTGDGAAGDVDDAGPDPLLDEAQVADAIRYYTSQPSRYTPAIVSQLRTALDLDAEGGVDAALVLAVAGFQSTDGAGDPALRVDGKAGPRTLPRIFRSGLNAAGEGRAFGEEVQSDVVDEWATLGTAEERLRRLVELINVTLTAHGVPAVTHAFDTNVSNAGSFDFPTWQMQIGRTRLGTDSISEEDARDMARTVFHEARHTEQWFRMAQLRAGQGLSAGAITSELGIPARIARAAKDAPLVRGSMEALVAQGWWDSVYGSGADHRDVVLTEIDRAEKARTRARTRAAANPTPANQAALERAEARFSRAHDAYRDLPEENDAWATEPEAGEGISGGSPEPDDEADADAGEAGDLVEEPAGSPPAAGRPSHEILPDEGLP